MCMLVLFLLPHSSSAAQPQSSHWFPEQLLNWNPENDPNAKYNRSHIPLAQRDVLYKVNENAQSDAKLVALSALNPNTSGVPSQGGKAFFANTFSYWQYADLMVYWAGSSGEGIIVPPSADVIDASHKNGVPILGNVFFPPTVYGGKKEWVEQMLTQRADGSFPAADKLLEVAEYYGFDGWFINQETEGGTPETAKKMQQFLVYLQNHKPEGMEIMWYDSMTNDGRINWQNALTDKNSMFLQDGEQRVSDSMFLNFWWRDQQSSYNKAQQLKRNPYDLYTGIDVEARGTSTSIPWEGIFPKGKAPYTSLGIYRPDWAFKTSQNMEEFYQKEQEFWVGKNGDPSDTEGNGSWKGMAHYFTAKTPIQELPFVTHFNTGSGKFFSVKGDVSSNEAWNNRSLQDVLPTWRWLKEGGQDLDVNFDWEQAYYGGSSLKLSGMLDPADPAHLKLYKTDLPIQKDTELSITHKANSKNAKVKVGISFLDDPESFIFLDTETKDRDEWTTSSFKLKKYNGKKLAAISLFVEGNQEVEDFKLHVGELKVFNKDDYRIKSVRAKGAKVSDVTFNKGIYADVSLEWSPVESNISHYEIYRTLPNGEKEWVGATPNHVYFLSEMKRKEKENHTLLEVVAVRKDFKRSKPAAIQFEWPPYPKPEADFRADKTIAAPGEPIQFTNESSEVTEEVSWEFEGGTPSISNEENPIVTYENEGVYSVTLTARNSEGEDILTREAWITISKDAKNITNVALNKLAEASGACAPSEGPGYALDGKVTDNSKWCALGTAPHWLKVDLGASHSISKFVVKHAQAGGEAQAFNTQIFKIQVSADGVNWGDSVQVTDNTQAVSEHSIPLTDARYFRLWIEKPTQGSDQAARIFEFEVYGYPSN
ncbi:discoidin domain-containing protein [Fictibacillus barbaricus]|uniref:Discoidin domain-containing protein n=2 Tax=Fictibacillus barbaricus TaxID=182136 RepID=A0ABS2ZGL4_9BACL|nr:discoidin domain-containing protein [Fictibacillus barbaricus]